MLDQCDARSSQVYEPMEDIELQPHPEHTQFLDSPTSTMLSIWRTTFRVTEAAFDDLMTVRHRRDNNHICCDHSVLDPAQRVLSSWRCSQKHVFHEATGAAAQVTRGKKLCDCSVSVRGLLDTSCSENENVDGGQQE
jgi:hypothetical protein